MLIPLLEVFALYLLAALLIRIIIKILPSTISTGFSIIADFRLAIGKFVRSLYRDETNFEVNMLAIFFLPFAILFAVFSFGSGLVMLNTDAPIINIWLVLALIFVLSFMAPTEEELQFFRESQPSSIFLFLFKIFLVLQLSMGPLLPYYDVLVLLVTITPISPYLR